MDILFVADIFADELPGGGEIVNDIVIQGLREKGHNVITKKSGDLTLEYFMEKVKNGFDLILGNHINVDIEIKIKIRELALNPAILVEHRKYPFKYIVYEHDHKYVHGRDPSPYKDFIAPKERLDGPGLYICASAVLCQSKIHAEVLTKNIPQVRAINLGCSLWRDDFIQAVENLNIKKTKNAAILKSNNPTKNQVKCEVYCRENNIDYDLISAENPKELLKILSEYKQYVFLPKVLETFCRVIVEAKLAGCKIVTNPKLIGVASESWFTDGSREQIIERIKQSKDATITTIEDIFSEGDPIFLDAPDGKVDITVILNSYRRPYNLEKQIEAIRNQSFPPKEIWLWVNDHEDNRDFDHTKLDVDKIFHNNHNWKFYGRFAAALLADTKYVAVFDDDTIPGENWFQNCIAYQQNRPGIYGSAGVILNNSKHYVDHERVGWPSQNEEIERVDLVGHAWFFQRDWLQYLWREKPHTWDNGEDIQFSYLAQKYGGILTYAPPHPIKHRDAWGSILGNELGIDDKATSTDSSVSHKQFFAERDSCIQNAIKGGWQTVKNLMPLYEKPRSDLLDSFRGILEKRKK